MRHMESPNSELSPEVLEGLLFPIEAVSTVEGSSPDPQRVDGERDGVGEAVDVGAVLHGRG